MPNKDDLPLVGSVHGRKIMSQLSCIAGDGAAAQDVTFYTTPAQPSEFLTHAKGLIDEHLKLAWNPALEQSLAIDKFLSVIRDRFAALKPFEKEALQTYISKDHDKTVVTEIIFYVWYKACSDFDGDFKADINDLSLYKKAEYFNLSLFAVVMLHHDHPLVYRVHQLKTVKDKIFGCSRLSRYHLLLGQIAKSFVSAILSPVCQEQALKSMLYPRTFCVSKEKARDKLRAFLLSKDFRGHENLREQWIKFEEVKNKAHTAASAAAETGGEFQLSPPPPPPRSLSSLSLSLPLSL